MFLKFFVILSAQKWLSCYYGAFGYVIWQPSIKMKYKKRFAAIPRIEDTVNEKLMIYQTFKKVIYNLVIKIRIM